MIQDWVYSRNQSPLLNSKRA